MKRFKEYKKKKHYNIKDFPTSKGKMQENGCRPKRQEQLEAYQRWKLRAILGKRRALWWTIGNLTVEVGDLTSSFQWPSCILDNLSSSKKILWLSKISPSISNFCSLPMMIINYPTLRSPFQVQMGKSCNFHEWVHGTRHILKLTWNSY